MWKQVIKYFGDENTKTLNSFQKQVGKINELETAMQALKNDDFPAKTDEFKKRIQDSESMNELIPETFGFENFPAILKHCAFKKTCPPSWFII